MPPNEIKELLKQSESAQGPEDIIELLEGCDPASKYFLGAHIVREVPHYSNLAEEYINQSLYFDLESHDTNLRKAAEFFDRSCGFGKKLAEWRSSFEENGGLMVATDSTYWFLHPSAQQQGKLQLTYYNNRHGGPAGDLQFKTFDDVFRGSLSAGIPLHAREIPFANIEEALTKLNGPMKSVAVAVTKQERGLSL